MRKFVKPILLILAAGFVLLAILMIIPGTRSRVINRVDQLAGRIFYSVVKPEESVFVPQGEAQPNVDIVTMTAFPTPTMTEIPAQQTNTPEPTATHTPEPTPLPPVVLLEGITYTSQTGHGNYCAPANLAMALSYWDWQGTVDQCAAYLKPFADDFNVMPYEMENYVNDMTELDVVLRYGGNLDLLKRFIAAGFPVLIEKGIYHIDITGVVSWMGHYNMVDGYDEEKQQFRTQDSLIAPNTWINYEDLKSEWRSFNYTFLVIYPPDKQSQIEALLGEYVLLEQSYQIAAQNASDEIYQTSGADQFFAWFNRGSSLVGLNDYYGGAVAYDEAYRLYPSIPEKERPYRITWYQTGPYYAYYYAGRYQDVYDLATQTITTARKPYLEESFYWRAKASIMIGDQPGAISDLCESLEYHPEFAPSVYELSLLGVYSCP